jgi:hypothetical protein
MSVNGYAVFSNISLVTVGTFYLEIFSSVSEVDTSPYTVQIDPIKISSGPLAQLRVLKMPLSWTVGAALDPLVVEMGDKYSNRIDCEYGECALPLYGFPALNGKRDWNLLPFSDAVVTASVDQDSTRQFVPSSTGRRRECGTSSNFIANEGTCTCLGGSLIVAAIEGVATLDCLSLGMSGTFLPLMLSSRGINLALAPISVEPGLYNGLYMMQEPMREENTAGGPMLFCEMGKGCVGLSVQMVDMCGNFLLVQEKDKEVTVEVSACPTSAGLTGTKKEKTVRGRATFTGLIVTRAKNMPCEIEDSMLYLKKIQDQAFVNSTQTLKPTCLTRQTPYVFIFVGQGASVSSSAFLVDNGPMLTLEIVRQPGNAVQGSVLTVQPAVKLVDAYGNTVTINRIGGFEVEAALVTGQGCTRTVDKADQCLINCDGTAINGICYKYFTSPRTFEEATADCINWGGEKGSLLPVTSQTTNEEILARISGGLRSWIGLKWDKTEADWIWTDEKRSNTDDYQNWGKGFPPLVDRELSGCVSALASLWEAQSCSLRLPYVCSSGASDEGLNQCNCCARITGSNKLLAQGGFVAFTDLSIASEPGIGFQMIFVAFPTPQSFGADLLCQGGPCYCDPLKFQTTGLIFNNIYENSLTCKWMISTVATIPGGVRDTLYGEARIELWFTAFDTELTFDYVTINECSSEACPNPKVLANLNGNDAMNPGPTAVREKTIFSTPTGFLQLVFSTDAFKKSYTGFRAEWRAQQVPSEKITAPPPDWQRASSLSALFDISERTSSLTFSQLPSVACAGQALLRQPHLVLVDFSGKTVINEPLVVSASISSSMPKVKLVGKTQTTSIMGRVIFTDLKITMATSSGVRLEFRAQSGTPPMPLILQSENFPVLPAAQNLTIADFIGSKDQPNIIVTAGETMANVVLKLYDAEGYQVMASNTAVGVTLSGAPPTVSTPAGVTFPAIIGTTEQTALNGRFEIMQNREHFSFCSRLYFSPFSVD